MAQIIDSIRIKGILYDIGVGGEGKKTIVVEARQVIVYRYSNKTPTILGGVYNFETEYLTPPYGWFLEPPEADSNFKRWMCIGFVLANSSDIFWSNPIEYIDGADIDITKEYITALIEKLKEDINNLQELKDLQKQVDELSALPAEIERLRNLLALYNNINIVSDEENTAIKIDTNIKVLTE